MLGEEPVPLAAGSTFGPYRVIEQLGKGGMASVYRAYEAGLDRYVALKILPAEFLHDESFAERFQREARVIARLEHAHIIPIFSFGLENKTPWMAMRLIAGGTLSSLLKTRRLTYPEIVRIIRCVAEALEYAHGKGVVHRDVKPQNILIDETGGVYLADFGIARMVEGGTGLTATGMITGTPNYMAPEQATGATVDHRCDIYSLGVVTYELLTGQVPFTADTPVAVLMKHMADPIPLGPAHDVPEPLFRAVLKALAKKPEDRWARATEFARALEAGLAAAPADGATLGIPATVAMNGSSSTRTLPGPTAAGRTVSPTATMPGRPSSSSLPLVLALGLGVLAVLALLAGGAWMLSRKPAAVIAEAGPATPVRPSRTEPPLRHDAAPAAQAPAAATLPPVTTLTRRPEGDDRRSPAPSPPPTGARTPAALALATEPTAAPAATGPSLDVDLDVVQDPEGPWGQEPVLYVQLKVDEEVVKSVRLDFGARAQLRQRVTLPVAAGPREVGIAVSKSDDMEDEATVEGNKTLPLAGGPNPVNIQVRFIGPDDWTIRFR